MTSTTTRPRVQAPRSHAEALAFVHQAVDSETDDCIVWPYPLVNAGYGQITINGQRWRVHRLTLALATKRNPPHLHAAHGECHNRACINPRHLSWKTPIENSVDRQRDGTFHLGSMTNNAKLTEDDVHVIRQMLAEGMSQRFIASRMGVRQATISSINRGETWAWLESPRLHARTTERPPKPALAQPADSPTGMALTVMLAQLETERRTLAARTRQEAAA